ncbi:MAG TPA: porin family protein [Gemmatimonadaceae bacterium]|nr:porin family protein [Gemmatimonadaceae bacterium]
MHRGLVSMAVAAALVAGLATGARAQSGLGIKGGLAYSDVSNAGVLPGDLHSRTGYAVGLGYQGGGPLGIGLEALYAEEGVTGGSTGQSRELNYVNVPLYLRLGIPAPGLSPFVYAGPQASFEVKCSAGGTSCPDTGRPKTTYAGVIGAGVRLAGGLTLEGRYVYGLTDLKLNTVTTSQNYKTRSFMVLLGLGF